MQRKYSELAPDFFANGNGEGQLIFTGGEGADPTFVIGTGGVVGVVEVEDEAIGGRAEISPFDGVVEVAPCAVGGLAIGGITKGQEDSTAITVNPKEAQCSGSGGQCEGHLAKAAIGKAPVTFEFDDEGFRLDVQVH